VPFRAEKNPYDLIWIIPAEADMHENMQKLKVKSMLIAVLGTVLEYYDYALYGFSAALLAKLYFPKQDIAAALLMTFGIYAMGSFAKPIGSFLFGRIADHYGRAASLKINLMGIAIPTIIIGCLPTYEYWGWISAAILMLCRIAQGVFVAGEYSGVVVYMYEHISRKRASFGNSLVGISSIGGIALASLAISLTKSCPHFEQVWRIPFIVGGIVGLLFSYLRQHLCETGEFIDFLKTRHLDKSLDKSRGFKPLSPKHLMTYPWKKIFITMLVCGSAGVCYHFYFIFWPTFLGTVVHVLKESEASYHTSFSLFAYAFSMPVAGLLSDRFGKYRIQLIGSGLLFLMILLNGYFVAQGLLPLWLMILTSMSFSLFIVPCDVINASLYPVKTRSSGMGIGHSLGSMIFSGTTPFMAMLLWQNTQSVVMPLFYVGAFIIVLMNIVANLAVMSAQREDIMEKA
jgi:MHS family proline/betaine transporter-like MFS transporter